MAACVGCGFECRRGPCGFSAQRMAEERKTWDPKVGCPYLRQVGIQWRCGMYIDGSPELQEVMALQFGPRRDDPAFALLLSFTRQLVRELVNPDMIALALYAAQAETGATKEQVLALHEAAAGYWKKNKIWPEGF